MYEDRPDPKTARRRDPDGVQAETWKQTLEEMNELAEARRSEGWEVLTVTAAHTDTKSLDMKDDDEFGLIHILPDNHAEEFEAMWDPDAFTEYLAYGTEVELFVYMVTELIDPENERAILVANRYDMVFAAGMIESAEQEGVLPTHFKTIDGTRVATFEHEEYGPLVPRPTEE